MAWTTDSEGNRREIAEHYAAVVQETRFGQIANYLAAMVREDDADEQAWLREAGYERFGRMNLTVWTKATKRAQLGGELGVLLERGYSIPGGRLFPGAHRDFTREAYEHALGHKPSSADFVFPEPALFS